MSNGYKKNILANIYVLHLPIIFVPFLFWPCPLLRSAFLSQQEQIIFNDESSLQPCAAWHPIRKPQEYDLHR